MTFCISASLLVACGDDDNEENIPDSGTDSSVADGGVDGSVGECSPRDAGADAGTECVAEETDYAPCSDDDWESCISDDGTYHPIDPSIGTIARIEAFDDVAELLFDPTSDPSAEDFEAARDLYDIEEGLSSRVNRRYDPHFEGITDCTTYTPESEVPEGDRDYCVGAALLAPTILDAFANGMASKVSDPRRVYAAQIEGALLWFLYVSPYKESLTCTTTIKDCDSSYAYYTGGQPRSGGIGLASYIREVDPDAHNRAWDGLLGVRCWRDLDSEATATNTELRDLAREQYDRALLDGVAAIVKSRLTLLDDATDDDEQAYYHAFLQTLGPVLYREMDEVSAKDRATLQTELEREAAEAVNVDAAIEAIDNVFQCP